MTINELQKTIINNLIIQLQKHPDLSLRTLSMDIGVSQTYMQKVMSGTCMPALDKLVELSNYFAIPLTVLFTPNTKNSQEIQIICELLNSLSSLALETANAQIRYMCITEGIPYKDNTKK